MATAIDYDGLVNVNDDKPSEMQENWEDIARRLRIQLERSLAKIESMEAKADDESCLASEAIHNLATAALSAFALERQAVSMDAYIRRESERW